jgi:hypothetical protein
MPHFDVRNLGGRDAVVEELALHKKRMGRIKCTIDTQNHDHLKFRRKGKKLNMVQSTGRREHQWCAAVEPRDNINYTYHKVANAKGRVDNKNAEPDLSSRLRKNRQAKRNIGTNAVNKEHQARIRNMNRRIDAYSNNANEQKKKAHITDFNPALLMRKEGDIAIITGSGMPDARYRWHNGHEAGDNYGNFKQDYPNSPSRRPKSAATASKSRSGGAHSTRRPQTAIPTASRRRDRGGADHASRGRASPTGKYSPRIASAVQLRLQRKMVDEIVGRRLFRAEDLEEYFVTVMGEASAAEKMVMPKVIAQLKQELEL